MKKYKAMKQRRRPAGRPAKDTALGLILTAALCITASGQLVSMQMVELQPDEVQTAGNSLPQPPAISAGAAILVDGESGKVLYEQEADKKMYPASTTKIMTALVTLELCDAQGLTLKNELMVPPEAEGVEGSSLYLKAGERITLEELLYGLMLQSGNDSAAALAVSMGGGDGQEVFVNMMNEKADRLGCTGTHFTNPSGLPDAEHYTTARDLALIACEAMKNDEFCRIVSTQKWCSKKAEGRCFANKNKTVFQYEGGNGVKIGYTKAAGRTLVASAARDTGGEKTQLIAVVLNDGNWFSDAYALLDYGFGLAEEGIMEPEERGPGNEVFMHGPGK